MFLPLLGVTLLLWRYVLEKPLLEMSQAVVEVSFALLPGAGTDEVVTVDGNGDWLVYPAALVRKKATMSRSGLRCFSVSLPTFWALALGVSRKTSLWRVLGSGTLLLTIVSQLSVVLYVACWALYDAGRWPTATPLLNAAAYFLVDVVPYAFPPAVLIWLDSGLRSLVFGESRQKTLPGRTA